MPARLNIPKGTLFGRLKVLKEIGIQEFPSGQTARLFLCECSCKNKTQLTVKLPSLRSGNTTSCGCVHRKMVSDKFKTHGLSKHPLYMVWCNMIDRCSNVKNKRYKDYGGRGIKVCKEWLGDKGILNFINWNNSLPKEQRRKKGLEIDRIHNDKGYYPQNCRWVTRIVNTNNTRQVNFIEYKGKKWSFKDFYRKYTTGDISYSQALNRLKQGMNPKKAVTLRAITKNRIK